MKRTPSVEFARIIACIMVLACHYSFVVIVPDASSPLKMYMTSILSDPVAIFWMITGFFLFNNTNYKKLWKHTFLKIIIPVLLLYIVCFYATNFILGTTSFSESISKSSSDYTVFFSKILCLKPPMTLNDHTWYVMAYILIILIYPILKSFVDYLDKDKTRTIVFLIISGSIFVLNDLSLNQLLDFSFHGVGVLIPASIQIIWGHIIYKNIHIFSKKIYIAIAPVAFLSINAIRTYIQYNLEIKQINSERILLRWSSSFSIICAICILTFAFSLIKSNKPSILNKGICSIASYTYIIYLIHTITQEFIIKHGFITIINDYFITKMPEWVYAYLTVFVDAIISFIICIIISILLRLIKKLLMLPFKSKTK